MLEQAGYRISRGNWFTFGVRYKGYQVGPAGSGLAEHQDMGLGYGHSDGAGLGSLQGGTRSLRRAHLGVMIMER
jgi:hypothetical protein